IGRGEPRLLGAVGYWLFDTMVLYVCLLAYGPSPAFWVVAMAYLVGLMANSIPIPAGLVAVEGGLIGMLVLFHVRPVAAVVAAVVTYRAISLWLPALIGSAAFFSLRREIGEPVGTSSGPHQGPKIVPGPKAAPGA
ncbi:MAG: flippase-like domain-containing protein, partial [Solirubrobacteraceae bacterium]